jgi:enoyl-CoA hydratase/carnithine racemase
VKHYLGEHNPMRGQYREWADFKPKHFSFRLQNRVAVISLNRPERKNPLSFDSYHELRTFFYALRYAKDVNAVVIGSEGGNFSSGGDVHDIIGPLTKMSMPEMLEFTRMTGDLVKAIQACPQVVIAAVDGICAGAGAMMALSSDLRLGSTRAKTAFLFTRVGLAGADMGACAMLPRVIGQGRAAELLYTGRVMTAVEAERWGFFNALHEPEQLENAALTLAMQLADGPTFGQSMTKTMLQQEWSMSIEQAVEAEAQAQAICMQTGDFLRAYEAFAAKQSPVFKGD